MRIQNALVAMLLTAAGIAQADEKVLLHAEIDPFPFATGRYGVQVGARVPALHGVRLAIAGFSVDVPDFLASKLYGEGTHVDVRPGSGAIYALYYFRAPGKDGFCAGVSMRYLRVHSTHDDAPDGVVDRKELSPEAIVGFQWHPFHNGFYLQPWLAVGVTAYASGSTAYGGSGRTPIDFDEPAVSPFFTVNIGYEQSP
jgi:hypothetical protein